jgi:hypothetical protein
MTHSKSNNFKEREKHEWTVEMMAASVAGDNESERIQIPWDLLKP